MKAVTGFFMAWGSFLAVPCPCRRWEESARPHMLAALPLIGAAVGGMWCAVWLLLAPLLPPACAALALAVLPWVATGFIHLDGYMDVCDAVLSRRDLPRRREILKDPHCGAFGVIAMVLLALGQWSLFFSAGQASWLALLCIPVASRSCAGLAVLHLRPMDTSQYANVSGKRAGFTVFLSVLLAAALAVPLLAAGSFAPLCCAAVYWLCVWHGYRQLDGMSGDVSGYALTLAELAGAAVFAWVG